MIDLAGESVERLRSVGVQLERGLRDEEFAKLEERFAFRFGAEHRAFLSLVLPVGRSWVDWRNGAAEDLRKRLAWPVESAIFDVLNNQFWPASWGDRPEDSRLAENAARARLAEVPKLVPVYSHRYLPASPAPSRSPVFSVYQTDVIFYGDNLLDYVAREFDAPPLHPADRGEREHIAFWSDLAEGAAEEDL